MAGDKIDFSHKALEQMNRGAQTNVLTSVKAGWTWFLFGSVSLFFAAMIIWGFYGSMVDSVSGVGLTMLSGGVRPVIAGGNGTISHLNIQTGSQVSTDQTVGQIYNPEMFFNIRKLESEYTQLKSEIEFMTLGTRELTERKIKIDKDKKLRLDILTQAYEKSKARAAEVTSMYAQLKSVGAASTVAYYQTLDQMLQTETSMLSTVFQTWETDWTTETAIWQRELRLLELRQQLEGKENELKLAHQLYEEAFWIRPGFDGQVLEVFKEEGAFVRHGEKIALVAADLSEGMYLVAFIPAEQGKKIKNGMSAFFSPAALPASEYGYLKCVVRETGNVPVNPESIQAELMNSSLTQMIAGKTAMVRVVLDILPDSGTESGFKWTSKGGAPGKITNGMLGQVLINTEYRPPASYIIPAIRELLHGDKIRKQDDRQ